MRYFKMCVINLDKNYANIDTPDNEYSLSLMKYNWQTSNLPYNNYSALINPEKQNSSIKDRNDLSTKYNSIPSQLFPEKRVIDVLSNIKNF